MAKRKVLVLAKEIKRQKREEEKKLKKENGKYFKFLKQVGVSYNEPINVINDKILNHIAARRIDFHKVALSSAQLNDSEFLKKMYIANDYMALVIPPNPDNLKIQQDLDMMKVYVKASEKYLLDGGYNISTFEDCFCFYEGAITNPRFVEWLIQEYPTYPIISMINDSCYLHRAMSNDAVEKRILEAQDKCLANIDIEILKKHIKNLGCGELVAIPKYREGYNDLVKTALKRDGFACLEKVGARYVLENFSLVSEAVSNFGSKGLYDYMRNLKRAKINSRKKEDIELLRAKIFENPNFNELLQREMLLNKDSKSIKIVPNKTNTPADVVNKKASGEQVNDENKIEEM